MGRFYAAEKFGCNEGHKFSTCHLMDRLALEDGIRVSW
jgi:hypothetical protein